VSPGDKQDVKLVYDLLSSIAVLPRALPTDSPITHATWTALRLVGKLYGHFLDAYTNINLSLHEQLRNLSAAAHLVMAIYSYDKGDSMPSQMYFDIQTTIKNVFFCVAKTQVYNPDGKFWIILIGTDALECLFGRIRTMIGNDSNADHLQLANRVESAAICSQILAENPDWEKGPRHLTLKTWRDEAGDVSAKIDHINPASWKGDVYVKNVVILTSWEEGRRLVSEELEEADYIPPFDNMDAGVGYDIFCPFGGGRKVLLDGLTVGERDEDEDEMDIQPIAPPTTKDTPNTTHALPSPDHLEADSIGDQLESLAEEGLERLAALAAEPVTKIKPAAYVQVHSSSGKIVEQHKSSVCRVYSEPLTVCDSRKRLECVRAHPRHDTKPNATAGQVAITADIEESLVCIEDLTALLVRSKDLIWLAVVQITDIKQSGVSVDCLTRRLLMEPNVRVVVRVMRLRPRVIVGPEGDWEWFSWFESLSHEVDGGWLQLLDPDVIKSSRVGREDTLGYAFKSSELLMIALLLFGNFRSETDRFLTVTWSCNFPYRNSAGNYFTFVLIKCKSNIPIN